MTKSFLYNGNFILKVNKIIIFSIFLLFVFSFNRCSNTEKTTIKTTSIKDTDKDGIEDKNDNCPLVANTNQLDTDLDGTGDVCEDDSDGDGILNEVDNCPLIVNPDQADEDEDNIGNACDSEYSKELTEEFTDNLLEEVVKEMIAGTRSNELDYFGSKRATTFYEKNYHLNTKDIDLCLAIENGQAACFTIPILEDEKNYIQTYKDETYDYFGNGLRVISIDELNFQSIDTIKDSIHNIIIEYNIWSRKE